MVYYVIMHSIENHNRFQQNYAYLLNLKNEKNKKNIVQARCYSVVVCVSDDLSSISLIARGMRNI